MQKRYPLAVATLCALLTAAPLHAQSLPACEQAYSADMNQIIEDISYAYKWMEDTFSYTWQGYGFNCNYNSEARQACATAAERISSAAWAGKRIVQQATTSGCFSCDTEYLWRVAHELDDFARKLAAQRVASDGSDLLTEMLRNKVNGVAECSATTGTPPALDPIFGQGGQPQPPATPSTGKCASVDGYPDLRLNSGFGWVLENLTLPECVTKCEGEQTCTGYDYNTDTSTCIIRSEPQTVTGLERYVGWVHYECR